MVIEILYFDGCPNVDVVVQRVREALEVEHVAADVRLVEVHGEEDAIARRFLGSPTIQVNGLDAELAARSRRDFGYMCRTYNTPPGLSGAPSVQTIINALRTA
jgi:hypothetical protein